MARRIFFVPIVWTMAGLAACGGGEERASTVESVPAASNTQQGDGSVSPTAEQESNVSSAELNSALLALEDLPTGWTTTSPEPEDDNSNFCGFVKGQYPKPSTDLTIRFQQAESGPFLAQSLEAYDGGNAEKVFEGFLESTRSCSEWTTTDDNGKQTKLQIGGLSFPKLGDETMAIRVTSEPTLLGVVEIDYVLVRRDCVLNILGYTEVGYQGIDSSQTEKLVRQADQKVESLEPLSC